MDNNDKPRGFREFHSDTSLYPIAGPSSSRMGDLETRHIGNFSSKSEPALKTKSHSLIVDADYTPSCIELYAASETLENIVAEGNLVGASVKRYRGLANASESSKDVSDKVLEIVYGTMKCKIESGMKAHKFNFLDLHTIDKILVKTEFLVYYNQFLNQLSLVKVMLYELMKNNFEYKPYRGITFKERDSIILTPQEKKIQDDVKDLDEALKEHSIKLAAAYARIRIAKKAIGSTNLEKLENILTAEVRQKEIKALEMPKTVRINSIKTNFLKVSQELKNEGFEINHFNDTSGETMYIDEEFKELIVVPSQLFSELKDTTLMKSGDLILQDKASMYMPKHLLMQPPDKIEGSIIDARAGCGSRVFLISSLLAEYNCSRKPSEQLKVDKIFAFENRPARIEALKGRMNFYDVKNVKIIESSFISSDVRDLAYEEVSTVIVEPPNSGTAIIDKLGYLLQEEEFPNEHYSQHDILSLKNSQINYLKHAFKFPNVKNVVYISRSECAEENEQVVEELMDRYSAEWELVCIMPEMMVETEDYEFEDCFKIKASEQGNGVYIAHFQKTKSIKRQEELEEAALDQAELATAAELSDSARNLTKSHAPARSRKNAQSKKKLEELALRRSLSKKAKIFKMAVANLSEDDNETEESNDESSQKKTPKKDSKRSLKLTSSQRALVNRLTDPNYSRRRSLNRQTSKNSNTSSKIGSSSKLHPSEKQSHSNQDSESEADEKTRRDHFFKTKSELQLYGYGLKRFYAPNFAAIHNLEKKKFESKMESLQIRDNGEYTKHSGKWIYPVPNPAPWK